LAPIPDAIHRHELTAINGTEIAPMGCKIEEIKPSENLKESIIRAK